MFDNLKKQMANCDREGIDITNYLGGNFYSTSYLPYLKSCLKHKVKGDFNKEKAVDGFIRRFEKPLQEAIFKYIDEDDFENDLRLRNDEYISSLSASISKFLDTLNDEYRSVKKKIK